jgi:predicted nucleotide-binding protein
MQVGALWVDGIMASLRAADFLIADVTGRNPNVLFELGIAHGLGKPFVILVSVDGNGDIPSDLMGYQYIAYHPGDARDLQGKLGAFVEHVVERLRRSS